MYKKRVWNILLIVCLSFLLFPIHAWALESDGFEFNIKDNQATITKYIGPEGKNVDVVVPSTLNGCPVTVFGGGGHVFGKSASMLHVYQLHSVTLPDTVVKIGKGAFGSSGLDPIEIQEIVLSKNLESIGEHAFAGSSFKSVILPNTLKSIGERAFAESSIQSIDIPDSVTDIGKAAFSYSDIRTCKMSSNVKTIPEQMFENSKLETITLKEGLESIEYAAFSDCAQLKRLEIPSSVKRIGKYAFRGARTLEFVNIPYGITKIESATFKGCEALKELIIPHSVTQIENWAFEECRSLVSLIIPDSVTDVGDRIISNCDNLESVYIPSSVVKGNLFNGTGCPKLIVYVQPGSYAEQKAKTKNNLSVVADGSVDYIASIPQNISVVHTAVPTWKQDAVGWWLENPDGSYLVNAWYQSPESGLWYYMGADGYMFVNTITPDGHQVGMDGAMIQ